MALLSLIPIVALGVVLAWVLRDQIVTRTLADATQSARLVARLGVQPRISPAELEHGLSATGVEALDEQLHARSVTRDLARIKIWNDRGLIVYSDDHHLIGQRPGESDDLQNALAGRPGAAAVVDPSRDSETSSEVGLGKLVEVYVPLRFGSSGPPAGAFEIYLSYAPIAAAIGGDERTIALVVALGLDRSLVTRMCDSPRDEAIVRTTVDLARHLGLSVIAEGIETPEVAERLAAIGCDNGQGYHFSRPLPHYELTAWLRGLGSSGRNEGVRGAERGRVLPVSPSYTGSGYKLD